MLVVTCSLAPFYWSDSQLATKHFISVGIKKKDNNKHQNFILRGRGNAAGAKTLGIGESCKEQWHNDLSLWFQHCNHAVEITKMWRVIYLKVKQM